jgi:putative ATPase
MSENTLLPEEAPSMYGQPLAARMRPSSLDEIAGQQHLLGP